jgi:hypothetical protein
MTLIGCVGHYLVGSCNFLEKEIFHDPLSIASFMFLCNLCIIVIAFFISSLYGIGIHICSGFKNTSLILMYLWLLILEFPCYCFFDSLYQLDVHVAALSANNHIIYYLRIIFLVPSRCRPLVFFPIYTPFMICRKFISADLIIFHNVLWQNHTRRQECDMKHNFKKSLTFNYYTCCLKSLQSSISIVLFTVYILVSQIPEAQCFL